MDRPLNVVVNDDDDGADHPYGRDQSQSLCCIYIHKGTCMYTRTLYNATSLLSTLLYLFVAARQRLSSIPERAGEVREHASTSLP